MPGADAPPTAEYAAVPSPNVRLTGRAIGLDIGGTGIKAGLVDLRTGTLVGERVRALTPRPATQAAVLDVVASVMHMLEANEALTADLPAGAAFPSVIRGGRAMTTVHGDSSWIEVDVERLLGDRLGRVTTVINDADAAGVAEVAYGAAKGQTGTVLLLDLGTGIGTAVFTNGQLVPNIQLGHVEFHGREAEARLSPLARKQDNIGLKPWAREFSKLLARYEAYLSPDLIIIGGGMVKQWPDFGPLLKSKARLVPAALGTNAGIVGAARVGGGRARR